MENSPYLKEHRLQDLLAAVQFLAAYPDYDLTGAEFHKKIATNPNSAGDWSEMFAEHPEFFVKAKAVPTTR